MQCVLSPTEMNQKTYITADHHVALNADNEQQHNKKALDWFEELPIDGQVDFYHLLI